MEENFYSKESIDKNIIYFYNFVKENINTIFLPKTKKKIVLEMLGLTAGCLKLDMDSILSFEKMQWYNHGKASNTNNLNEIKVNNIKLLSNNFCEMFCTIIHETLHSYTYLQNQITIKNGDWENYKYLIGSNSFERYRIDSFPFYATCPNELFSREKSWEILGYIISKIEELSKNETNTKMLKWIEKLQSDFFVQNNQNEDEINKAKKYVSENLNFYSLKIRNNQIGDAKYILDKVNNLPKNDEEGRIKQYKILLYDRAFFNSSNVYFNSEVFSTLIQNDKLGEKIVLETFIKNENYNVLAHKYFDKVLLNCVSNNNLNYPLWIRLMGEKKFFNTLAYKYSKAQILDKIPTEFVSKNALKTIDETIEEKKEINKIWQSL